MCWGCVEDGSANELLLIPEAERVPALAKESA